MLYMTMTEPSDEESSPLSFFIATLFHDKNIGYEKICLGYDNAKSPTYSLVGRIPPVSSPSSDLTVLDDVDDNMPKLEPISIEECLVFRSDENQIHSLSNLNSNNLMSNRATTASTKETIRRFSSSKCNESPFGFFGTMSSSTSFLHQSQLTSKFCPSFQDSAKTDYGSNSRHPDQHIVKTMENSNAESITSLKKQDTKRLEFSFQKNNELHLHARMKLKNDPCEASSPRHLEQQTPLTVVSKPHQILSQSIPEARTGGLQESTFNLRKYSGSDSPSCNKNKRFSITKSTPKFSFFVEENTSEITNIKDWRLPTTRTKATPAKISTTMKQPNLNCCRRTSTATRNYHNQFQILDLEEKMRTLDRCL